MKIETRSFGYTKNEEEVLEMILSNDSGISVHILTFGAAIRKLIVPDRNKNPVNVVLGYEDIRDYEKNPPYLGVVVGRYAGRINGAEFTIDNTRYEVEKNNDGSCLHGGFKGLSRANWKVSSENVADDTVSIVLEYHSPDGEDHFPGNVDFITEYSLNNKNELSIEYTAVTDMPTLINMTNHSYFNFNNDPSEDIKNHYLTLDADTFIEGDQSTLGISETPVYGTPFDFRKTLQLGEGIDSGFPQIDIYGGYDHVFRINGHDINKAFARLYCESSGIEMNVHTTCQAVVLYTSNMMDDALTLCDNVKTKKHLGVCLETQYFPNDINCDFIKTQTILRPGEKYNEKTIYRF